MGKLKDYYQSLREEPLVLDDYDYDFLDFVEQQHLETQEMLVSYFKALEELKDI